MKRIPYKIVGILDLSYFRNRSSYFLLFSSFSASFLFSIPSLFHLRRVLLLCVPVLFTVKLFFNFPVKDFMQSTWISVCDFIFVLLSISLYIYFLYLSLQTPFFICIHSPFLVFLLLHFPNLLIMLSIPHSLILSFPLFLSPPLGFPATSFQRRQTQSEKSTAVLAIMESYYCNMLREFPAKVGSPFRIHEDTWNYVSLQDALYHEDRWNRARFCCLFLLRRRDG